MRSLRLAARLGDLRALQVAVAHLRPLQAPMLRQRGTEAFPAEADAAPVALMPTHRP